MKEYTNISRDLLSFTLNGENGGDHIIPPGSSAELPSDNAHVVSLVAQKYLKETDESKNVKKDK